MKNKTKIEQATFVVKMIKEDKEDWHGNVTCVTEKKKVNVNNVFELCNTMQVMLENIENKDEEKIYIEK